MASVSTNRRQGLNSGAAVKVPCKAATTANITLSGEQTIDGVSCVDGDRVLVWQQTTGSENGIYVVSTSSWQRDKDFDGVFDVVKGTLVHVTDGTTYERAWFEVTTSNPITPGSTTLTLVATIADAANVQFTPSGTGAQSRAVSDKLQEWVSLLDFIPESLHASIRAGTNTTDLATYIDAAIAAASTVLVPPGTYLTSGNHALTAKSLIGVSPLISIIQLSGANTAGTLFVNGVTDASTPGTWGSGLDIRIENVHLKGNWDASSGLTGGVGILQANYSVTSNKALVKVVSSARVYLKNCYFSRSYEHGVLIYRSGYSEVTGNRMFDNRGSGIWLDADSSSTANTSTIYGWNKIETNKGYYGGFRAHFTYGVSFVGNLLEANKNYNWYLEEGAECSFVGNYAEAATTDAFIDVACWGYSFINEYYQTQPTIPVDKGHTFITKGQGFRHRIPDGVSNVVLQKILTHVGGASMDTASSIRFEGSSTEASDNCAAEIALEANEWSDTKSRWAFKTNNGSDLAVRARISELGSLAANVDTAIPAGGTAGKGLLVSSTANFGVFFGSGAPSLSAAKGSLYLRSDGSSTSTRAYINTDGGTTWTALTTVA